MLRIAEKIKTIHHPAVSDIYLKREFDNDHKETDVLIIQAKLDKYDDNEQSEHNAHDSYIIDILTDLNEISARAAAEVGHFDRVDIRRA